MPDPQPRHASPDGLTRWWRSVSLRAKVTGVTVAVLLIGLLATGVGTMLFLRSVLIAGVNTQAAALAQTDLDTGLFDIEVSGSDVVFTPKDDVISPEYFVAIYGPEGALRGGGGLGRCGSERARGHFRRILGSSRA